MSRRNINRPRGQQSKLAEAFLPTLLRDFEAHGAIAIEQVRQADPGGYLRIVASIIPKHVEVGDVIDLDMLTDEQLEALIREHVVALADEGKA